MLLAAPEYSAVFDLEMPWKGIGRKLLPLSFCQDFGERRCLCRQRVSWCGT